MYEVEEKKKVAKELRKLPKEIQQLYAMLLVDLATNGPEQPSWSNYSKLAKTATIAI